MDYKDFIVVDENNEELRTFLERVLSSGSAAVGLGTEAFEVSVKRLKTTDEAKRVLLRGGPDDRD